MACGPLLPEAALSNDGWCISVKQGDDQRDVSEGPSRMHYTLCFFCGLNKSSLRPWWPISSLVVSLSLRQRCHSRKEICAAVVLSELIWFLVIRYHSVNLSLQMRPFRRPHEYACPRYAPPYSTTSISLSKQPWNSYLCVGYITSLGASYTSPPQKPILCVYVQFCFCYTISFSASRTSLPQNTTLCLYVRNGNAKY